MAVEPLDMSSLSEIATEDLQELAQVAETGERYEDMCKFMNEIIKKACGTDEGCTTDQRNMLSVAFKNVVGAKRQSMRNLKEEVNNNKDDSKEIAEIRKKYLNMVEAEVISVCNQVLAVVVNGPLKKETSQASEAQVFWLKMCGDYCRYLSEIEGNESAKVTVKASIGSDAEEIGSDPAKAAETFYKQAMKAAKDSLPETHPTRLGLALNYSVCYYEILNKKEEACTLAKEAFDQAIEKLDTLNDKSYKDSTLIMQLLRDNLTLWTQNQGADKDAPTDGQ